MTSTFVIRKREWGILGFSIAVLFVFSLMNYWNVSEDYRIVLPVSNPKSFVLESATINTLECKYPDCSEVGKESSAQRREEADNFIITISIVSSGRMDVLQRLLQNLSATSNPSKRRLNLMINMPFKTNTTAMQRILDIEWKHGSKLVRKRVQDTVGAATFQAEAWYPSNNSDYGLFMSQEDVVVSPHWLHWVERVIASGLSLDERVFGVGLVAAGAIPYTNTRFRKKLRQSRGELLGLQAPSMGCLIFPRKWRMLLEYIQHRLETHNQQINVFVPRAHQIRYPHSTQHKLGEGRHVSNSEFDYNGAFRNSTHSVHYTGEHFGALVEWYMLELMWIKDYFILYSHFGEDGFLMARSEGAYGQYTTGMRNWLVMENKGARLVPDTKRLDAFSFPRKLNMVALKDSQGEGFNSLPALATALKSTSCQLTRDLVNNRAASKEGNVGVSSDTEKSARTLAVRAKVEKECAELQKEAEESSKKPDTVFLRKRYDVDERQYCSQLAAKTYKFVSDPNKITLYLSTIRRYDTLMEQIKYYSRSPVVSRIVVTMHSLSDRVPRPTIVNNVTVRFVTYRGDDLSNRFTPLLQIDTAAVLILDDDMKISLVDLAMLFEVWKAFPRNIIGFNPRFWDVVHEELHYNSASEDPAHITLRKVENYKANGIGSDILPMDSPTPRLGYGIMLTKIMMLHKDYLYSYACDRNIRRSGLHEMVRGTMNCEDLLMNGLVASIMGLSATAKSLTDTFTYPSPTDSIRGRPVSDYMLEAISRSPPMFVTPLRPIGDWGKLGEGNLHLRKSHAAARDICLRRISSFVHSMMKEGHKRISHAVRRGEPISAAETGNYNTNADDDAAELLSDSGDNDGQGYLEGLLGDFFGFFSKTPASKPKSYLPKKHPIPVRRVSSGLPLNSMGAGWPLQQYMVQSTIAGVNVELSLNDLDDLNCMQQLHKAAAKMGIVLEIMRSASMDNHVVMRNVPLQLMHEVAVGDRGELNVTLQLIRYGGIKERYVSDCRSENLTAPEGACSWTDIETDFLATGNVIKWCWHVG